MITVRFTEKDKTVSIIQTKYFYYRKNIDAAEEYKFLLPDLSKAFENSKEYYILHFPIEKIVKEVISFDIISIDNIKCCRDKYFFGDL